MIFAVLLIRPQTGSEQNLMTIRMILTGTQSGVEQAARDAAAELGLPCQTTAAAASEAEGTLIVSNGPLDDEGDRDLAPESDRPRLHVDLQAVPAFKAAGLIIAWLNANGIGVLHVSGPQEHSAPGIYAAVRKLIAAAFYLDLMKADAPGSVLGDEAYDRPPASLDEAVEILLERLPLKDKVRIANLTAEGLDGLRPSLGMYIRNRFKLWIGNPELLQSCRGVTGNDHLNVDDAVMVIIRELWQRLRDSHRLRAV
jgi:hypothetical protein